MRQAHPGEFRTDRQALFAAYRYRRHGAKRAQEGPQAFRTNHPQQPADVVARGAQHRVEPVADLAPHDLAGVAHGQVLEASRGHHGHATIQRVGRLLAREHRITLKGESLRQSRTRSSRKRDPETEP